MEQDCAVCGGKAAHRCASCQSVSYCSAEHQKEDWNGHRKHCRYFKIVEDSNLGKGFIATRDIKAGTVIFEEEPVAVSPVLEISYLESRRGLICCLTCGLTDDEWQPSMTGHRCTRCKWPICSTKCEELPMHAENERKIFASHKFEYEPESTGLSDLVMGIRVGRMKKNNPGLYEQILELCSEFSLDVENDIGSSVNTLKVLLAGVEGLELHSEEITKLLKIFRINCFVVPLLEKPAIFGFNSGPRCICGLALQSSRINHSCTPNCHWELMSMQGFKMRIQTTRAVKKGEYLTTCYWLKDVDQPTHIRQQNILKMGQFLSNVQLQLGWALQGQCEALKSQTKYNQAQRNSLEALALLRKSLKFFKHDFPTQFPANLLTAEGEEKIFQNIIAGDDYEIARWADSRFSNLNLNN